MASPSFKFPAVLLFNFLIFFFFFFFFIHQYSCSSTFYQPPPPAAAASIHDLLKSNGLPAGLLPKDVKSYTLSENGVLQVFLEGPCLTKFDTMALYESVFKANLTYRSLKGVEGFSQEELFLWLPVKDIIVHDPMSGVIVFDIGVAQKQLSLSLFEDPPDCKQAADVLRKKTENEEKIGADK